MTKLSIDLPDDLAAEVPQLEPMPEVVDKKLASFRPFLETMANALGSPRGMKLTYDNPAQAKQARFRFYRARRHVASQGITTFNSLTILVEGSTLLLRKDTPPQIEEL
jgi:hypothetical protein